MRYVWSFVVLTSIAAPVHAVDFRMIVDRDPEAVEIFIQIPAPLIPEHIGDFPTGFVDDQGRVDISPFRNGTFDQGDYIFRNVTATVGGVDVLMESMSMMVHPPEFDVTFRDPLDAMTAISVCNVPDPDAQFQLDQLMGYLGYIAYPVDGYAPITVTFPHAANIVVMDFRDGRLTQEIEVTTEPGEQIFLPENRPSGGMFGWLWG